MGDDEGIRGQVREFIEDGILGGGAEVAIGPDTPLLELGILTSLSTMRLLSFIRDRFGVEIPMTEVTGDNFRDLATIATLVSGHVSLGVRNV